MKRVFLLILSFVIASNSLFAQPRITGGFPINITDAPWQVLLRCNGQYSCGGSIIAPNFILTAKHCVAGIAASNVQVVAGVTCKNEVNSSNTFNVSSIILHPDPNVDAALLQLSSNITFNNNRQPVNYWMANDNALYNVGNLVRVSGWGWTIQNNQNSVANCLQAVNMNIISNQDASSALRPSWGRDLRAHEMAATGNGNIRQGACHGDSGGPLTILTATNEPVLIGIVQGGIPGCGGNNNNSPSVFVRVSNVLNWIFSNIVSISGSSFICLGSSYNFSVTNAPTGFTWNKSSNVNISGSGTTVSVTGTSSGVGFVRIMLGNQELKTHNFWVGPPTAGNIIGPTSAKTGGSLDYSINYSGGTDVTWSSTGSPYIWSMGGGASITYYQTGTWKITVAITNQCGFANRDHWVTITGLSCNCVIQPPQSCPCLPWWSPPYPNPASDIINIELDKNLTSQSKAPGVGTDPTFDIRLYDGLGNIVRQTTSKGGTVQFNINNLPEGLYYMHIYDGVSKTPRIEQILVER